MLAPFLSSAIYSIRKPPTIRWKPSLLHLCLAGALGLVVLLTAGARPAAATPLIALQVSNNCAACHKPGRAQRPVLSRRCTLDCQGCHIDPDGGGARNQWGSYYSQDQLATVNFFQPEDPLQDQSRFDLHYDGRILKRQIDDTQQTFPMSSELTLRVRPFVNYLHLVAGAELFGRVGDQSLRALRSDSRRYREKYAVMVDNLPLNTFVRAYRGQPLYGLRHPNHSLWIRERLGLDQFAATDAVEIGSTPNVPFAKASYMLGDPYAAPENRQKGISAQAGLRGVTLGWHVGGSAWETASEKTRISMRSLDFGLKPWKFILMGERNWRQVTKVDASPEQQDTWESAAPMVFPSSRIDAWTVAFAGIPGVTIGHVSEELHDSLNASQRRSIFINFHPVPFVQLEIWRRFESGSNHLIDTLGVLHLYADL